MNFLTIEFTAGKGGEEPQNFAYRLREVFLKFFDFHKASVVLMESKLSEYNGNFLDSASYVVFSETDLYPILSRESGEHALLRLSPFDIQHRRHTSFCQIKIRKLLPYDPYESYGSPDVESNARRRTYAEHPKMQVTDHLFLNVKRGVDLETFFSQLWVI